MAYRYGDRHQISLIPESIEGYVDENDPVRAYDAFVESIDLSGMKIEQEKKRVGNSEYNPQSMLKVLLYGYSYGIRSSRKLERALYHNLSFIWLAGGLKPDHKTIARFRKNNLKVLKQLLSQTARMCLKMDLIEGNTLFVDGTKIRSNASARHSWDQKRVDKYLKKADQRIASILSKCEQIDKQEEDTPSLVKMKEELSDQYNLRKKMKEIIEELKKSDDGKTNTVDKDCRKMTSRSGKHASYNVQAVADEKNGLLVSVDAVQEVNDRNQLSRQIEKAQKSLGQKCPVACADMGYANTSEGKKLLEQGITVVVPSQEQSTSKSNERFCKSKFKYDSQKDVYICPMGEELKRRAIDKEGRITYQIRSKQICLDCSYYGLCTKSKKGRGIKRHADETIKIKLESLYESNLAIYKKRKDKIELPFGHIKRNLGVRAFLMRGLDGVSAEVNLFATCFNLRRMINLLGGTQQFIAVI